jgi:energy-coupling factor transport system permease protein
VTSIFAQPAARPSRFTNLDVRAKLALMTALTVVSFLWESPAMTGGLVAGVALLWWAADLPARYVGRLIGLMAPFFVTLILTQGFFGAGLIRARTGGAPLTPLLTLPEAWWLVGGATLWLEGVLYAAAVIFKTVTMALLVPLVVFTTDVNAMIVGLVKLRVPYKVAFIFSSTLRFFPLLLGQIEAIIQAQRLRGLALEEMGWWRRVRVYAKIAVPLILGAMVKSQTLEVVLQSKAFSGARDRTYLHTSRLRGADYGVIALSGLLLILALAAYGVWGLGSFGGFN